MCHIIRVETIIETSLTLLILSNLDVIKGEITNREHRTPGALTPKNELSCYQCDTMVEGEKCSNLGIGNKTALINKCQGDKRLCMVKRYSYTTSTENSTSVLRMWSLQRNCTSRCEPGCIIIGERTKLYACTACCTSNACNDGKGGSNSIYPGIWSTYVISILILLTRLLLNLPFS